MTDETPALTTRTDPTREALLDDLAYARGDLLEIAARHGMTLDALSAWIAEPSNRRCLARLCELADTQTQLLMSRYRVLAASRLIRMATQPGEVSDETARKACVDLLKLEIKRAAGEATAEASDEDEFVLRDAVYGDGAWEND